MFALHFSDSTMDHRMMMLELTGTEFRVADNHLYNVYGQWVPLDHTSIAGPMIVDNLLVFDSITIEDGRFVGHSSSNFCFDVPVTLNRIQSICAMDHALGARIAL